MTRKSAAPDSLRLWVDTLRKVPPAFGNVPRKNIPARQLSAFGQSSAKSLASVRKCTPKRRSGQTTSGCLFPPITRLPKRPVAITRKSTAPDSLRLLVNPFRKISPVARCDDPKKCSSRQPSAFGQSSAKSHSSLWKCTPKKYSRQTAFGFGSIPCKKSRQRPEMYPERTFRPDNLRLPFPTDREAPQAARCDNPKKCSFRQPSALDLY